MDMDIDELKMPTHPDLWRASFEEVENGRIVRLHGDEVRKNEWTLRGANHWVTMESDGMLRIDWDGADARLAAAAPELLEEVKRQQVLICKLQDILDKLDYDGRYDGEED